MKCHRCTLHENNMRFTQGIGSIPADILFMGDPPSKSEEILGEAFVGMHGRLLRDMISAAIPSEYSYYLMHCMLCRPCIAKGEDNREPTKEDVMNCRWNTLEVINLVDPKVVVFCGKIAEQYYHNYFPQTITIQNPMYVHLKGGTSAPSYLYNVRLLEKIPQILKDVQNGSFTSL